MLSKLRLNPPQGGSPTSGHNPGGPADMRTSKTMSPAEGRSKLKKRKPGRSASQPDKRLSVPDFSTKRPSGPYQSKGHSSSLPKVAMTIDVTNQPRHPIDFAPQRSPRSPLRASSYIPDHKRYPAVDLRKVPDGSSARPDRAQPPPRSTRPADIAVHPVPTTGKKSTVSSPRNLHRSTTDGTAPSGRKLAKNPPPDNSAVKRHVSYAGPSSKPSAEDGLSEEDLKGLFIQATRVPEFSLKDNPKRQSEPIQVTIVDHLPHQKRHIPPFRSSTRKSPSIPPPILESDINEEYLLDQTEVLLYLQNTLIRPPTPPTASSISIASDGGLPETPPSTKPAFPDFETESFVESLVSEFPFLAEDDLPFSDTAPLALKEKSVYPSGTPDGSSSSLELNDTRRLEFPPSPPSSERMSKEISRAVLDELASESESMRSIVDAINRASSMRSSFDGYFYEESSILPFESDEPWADERSDDGTEPVYFAAPILRTGRASVVDLGAMRAELTRSPSQSSVFEDFEVPISQILAEKRASKAVLAPIITTPIVPGQYGPPLQRRQHLRGNKPKISPISARAGNGSGAKPTLVKVVEEEVVEYMPIEKGEKGWMRQRRVSRGGNWVVVEKEILKKGTI